MAQPVKLSDRLINTARNAAPSANRSLAAQVEHWATLGMAVEGALTASQSARLKNAVCEPTPAPYVLSSSELSAALAQALSHALSPGAQSEFAAEIATSPQPRFGTDAAFPGCIIRYNADGSITPGFWTDNKFAPLELTRDARAPPATGISRPSRTRKARARA